MDKIQKALQKLSNAQQAVFKQLLFKLKSGDWSNMDLKKLQGHQNIFRVRKGKLRVIFTVDQDQQIKILTLERRSDNTYNQY